MLRPFGTRKYGIVIEIKAIDKDSTTEQINKTIIEVYNQIDSQMYYKELVDNKMEKIIKLPIVFAGKELFIKII